MGEKGTTETYRVQKRGFIRISIDMGLLSLDKVFPTIPGFSSWTWTYVTHTMIITISYPFLKEIKKKVNILNSSILLIFYVANT